MECLDGGHVGGFGAGIVGIIDAVTPDCVLYSFGIGFFGPVGANDTKVGRSSSFGI